MKIIYKKYKMVLMLLGLMVSFSCEKAQYRDRYKENEISDVFATYEGRARDRVFGGRVVGDTVFLDIDYYYPIDSDVEMDISKLLIRVSVPSDSKVYPSLNEFWDLTTPKQLTVTSGSGDVRNYIVKALKRGNTEIFGATLSYEDVTGAAQETQAIIVNDKINFSLVPGTVMNNAKITYSINRHSTASIANGGAVDLSTPGPLVVSSVGDARRSYTMQVIEAKKLDKGIRPGSARIMFARRLKADLGIGVDNMTGGIAATGRYIVLNTRGENSVYINALTGVKEGEIDLGGIKGSLKNFYTTADNAGNIFVSNLTPNDGNVFTISKLSSVTASPQPFIQWNTGGTSFGRKFSIIGNVNSNAIITAPVVGVLSGSFARWRVVNGSLISQVPEMVTISDYTWSNNNVDVIYTSPTNPASDYFAIGYSNNRLVKVNGATNKIAASLEQLPSNFIANAVDYIEFNNAKFVTYNHVNSFSWGSADQVFLIDTEGGFSGDPSAKTTPGLVWSADKSTFGPSASGGAVNGNGTGDVAMRVSDNGYYLYLYFMFTNGYVVGVQFDCVDVK